MILWTGGNARPHADVASFVYELFANVLAGARGDFVVVIPTNHVITLDERIR